MQNLQPPMDANGGRELSQEKTEIKETEVSGQDLQDEQDVGHQQMPRRGRAGEDSLTANGRQSTPMGGGSRGRRIMSEIGRQNNEEGAVRIWTG